MFIGDERVDSILFMNFKYTCIDDFPLLQTIWYEIASPRINDETKIKKSLLHCKAL